MKNKLALGFLVSLSAFVLFSLSASPQKERESKISIIGKWRVTSDNPNDIKNHTYEFLTNNTCIEKYRSEQAAGSIDAPPEYVEMDAVITYRYKSLGGKRYRLYPTKSLVGGRPTHLVPVWHVIDVTITKNKAVVYVAARQETEIGKVMDGMLDAIEKDSKKDEKKARPAKREQQTWMRVT